MCDCKWDLSCFAVSNTELKSAFGVKHNIHLLLCTTADDLLSSNTIQLSSNTIVIKNNVSYWLQIPQLSTQLNNLRCNVSQCGQWNKEKDEVWHIYQKLFSWGRNKGDWLAMDEEPAARIYSWWWRDRWTQRQMKHC